MFALVQKVTEAVAARLVRVRFQISGFFFGGGEGRGESHSI